MKRIPTLLISLLLTLGALAQTSAPAESADAVADAFFQKAKAATLVADFNLTTAGQPMHYTGHITMRGECFSLTFLDNEAAYDGKTFYMYQADSEELTLSIPTREELLEINPMLFAHELRKNATLRKGSTKAAGKQVIEFIPKNKEAGVTLFSMTLGANHLPEKLIVKETGQQTTITFQNAKWEDSKPTFKLEKKGAFVNDMR